MQTADHTPGRKLFSTGELLTLGGVVCAIISAPMTWAYDPPATSSMVGVVYVERYTRNAFFRSAYELPLGFLKVGWAVVLVATICGSFLLFTPAQRQRPLYLAAQLAGGAFILGLA